MVEMRVAGLSLDPHSKTPIILLREEEEGGRILPILIGSMEALALSLVLNGERLPRPLAHDLVLMSIQALKGTLVGVEIADMKEGVYYALLVVRHKEGLLRIDCRPSDAIAVALKANVRIRVHERVLTLAKQERQHLAERRAAGDLVQEKADAATEMAKEADALREAAQLARRLAQGDELAASASSGKKNYESLLRSLEPITSRKM